MAGEPEGGLQVGKEMVTVDAVTHGVFVRIEAKQGNEDDVKDFLEGALPLVEQEPATTAWFAIRFSDTTFGIFDVFPHESGRTAHLTGRVAEALMENAGKLYESPTIEQVDLIASKLPM